MEDNWGDISPSNINISPRTESLLLAGLCQGTWKTAGDTDACGGMAVDSGKAGTGDSSQSRFRAWRTRPVFVSSTFRDMHAERDWLRNHVFPILEERLRERFHHLEPIDLRWGVETRSVSEQEAKELLVLKVCLAELERSRPFLIGLLGDRYGWTPPEDRMVAAAREAGFQGQVAGKSVTALEIEYGALENIDQCSRTWFYLREPLPYDRMKPEVAALYSDLYSLEPGAREAYERLKELKQRLLREQPGRVRTYQTNWDGQKIVGLEAFGNQVLEDLWADLELETSGYLQVAPTSWQQEEASSLEQFVEESSRDFKGREELLQELVDFALGAGSDWGTLLVGDSGTGKSAVFAKLVRMLEGEDVLVLSHAAGVTWRSSDVESLLERWCGELAAFLELEDNTEGLTGLEELTSLFLWLLGHVAEERRVVCLVDALNQFERTPTGRFVTWLPEVLPDRVRFIGTAIPGEESVSLSRRRGLRLHSLTPLSEAEAGALAQAVCARYHKALAPELLQALTEKRNSDEAPASGSPLWLELALEELLLLDADDFQRAEREYEGTGEQRLYAMMLDVAADLPPETEELYGWLLRRAEELYGHELVGEFCGLVATSRAGLRESDLPELMPFDWDALRFAALRRALRAHLVQRGTEGQWDFFHAQMREAVRKRYLADPWRARELHLLLARHFAGLPDTDPLRASEPLYHFIRADEKAEAARLVSSIDMQQQDYRHKLRPLAEFIREAGDKAEMDEKAGLGWLLALVAEAPGFELDLSNFYLALIMGLDELLIRDCPLAVRLSLLEAVSDQLQRLVEQGEAGESAGILLASAIDKVGDIKRFLGQLDAAVDLYQRMLETASKALAVAPKDRFWRHAMVIGFVKAGELRFDQGNLEAALTYNKRAVASAEQLVEEEPGLFLWHQDLGLALGATGDVYRDQGHYNEALAQYEACLAQHQWVAKDQAQDIEGQRQVAAVTDRIGYTLLQLGRTEEAASRYQESLGLCKRIAQHSPDSAQALEDLSTTQINYGDVLQRQGNLAGAKIQYEDAAALRRQLVEADPGNTTWLHDLALAELALGEIEQGQAALDQALELFQSALQRMEQLRATDPGNTWCQHNSALCHDRLAHLLPELGRLDEALAHQRQAAELDLALVVADPENLYFRRDVIGPLGALADLEEQAGHVEEALEQRTRQVEHALVLAEAGSQQPFITACVSFARVLYKNQGHITRSLLDEIEARLKALDTRASKIAPTEWKELCSGLRAAGKPSSWFGRLLGGD